MASPVFLSPSWFFGAKMYELTLALFVPSYGAQETTRAAQGGWDIGPRLFRIRLRASSPFWVSLAYFSAALKSLHQGKPQIERPHPIFGRVQTIGPKLFRKQILPGLIIALRSGVVQALWLLFCTLQ